MEKPFFVEKKGFSINILKKLFTCFDADFFAVGGVGYFGKAGGREHGIELIDGVEF